MSSSIAAGTVVTSDYLPWVRATAESFAEHHPGARYLVLSIDEPRADQVRDGDPFELVGPQDVGLSSAELGWLALIYSKLELSCALKPVLLRRLLAEADAAIYLDADMLIYGSLAGIAEQARTSGLVLSPHALSPRTNPALETDDDLLSFGQFNAGFLAVGRDGLAFVDWWASRLARDCPDWDPAAPRRYLDQRWLDLAVGYFNCVICRDPGINVARWNLHQRELAFDDDGYLVDGRPLRVFHFSAFDPANPTSIKRDNRWHPRVDPSHSPPLRRLAEDYAARVKRAGWRPRVGDRSVAEIAGLRLTAPVQAAVRAALTESERLGVAPVGGPDDERRLLAWLRAPVTPQRLSWYLGLWTSHPGVRGAFPNIPGGDEQRLLGWSSSQGLAMGLVPGALAGPAAPLALDGLRRFVALVEIDELLDDRWPLVELAREFSAADDVTVLLRAPGRDPDGLIGELQPLLAQAGLDAAGSVDMLALVDPVPPALVADQVGAILTRRPPQAAFVDIPVAGNAAALRSLTRTPLPVGGAASASS
jgi:hypothetical protein